MGKRIYLQWVSIYPDGQEEPEQSEYTGNSRNRIRRRFLNLKKLEGNTGHDGTVLKKGSVRVIEFENHSDEPGVIIYE